ncbi:uncharacterized protein FMAN_08896 [Fusarium mangiferae]|uniref:Uncharacterized protein n=1 Tax=Fusarium mangiferae TaxID=192010 RepID=A0A1L7T5I5_FUSMA|nr:uncharacterized protein FMAN_08896 [Fusarium mangiferae]CVK90571.1 uncharacterized protein FMAN_08896 [Fusarium mangiferae]
MAGIAISPALASQLFAIQHGIIFASFLACNVCQQPRWDLLSVVIGIQCLLSIDLDVFALA